MNLRAWTMASVAAFSMACGVVGDDSSSTDSDLETVHPTGSSTLGSLSVTLPESLEGSTAHQMSVYLQPAPENPGLSAPSATSDALSAGRIARVVPGKWCLHVDARMGNSTLSSKDCNVVVSPGGATVYKLARLYTTKASLDFLASQRSLTDGVQSIPLAGEDGGVGGTLDSVSARDLASTKGKVSVSITAQGATWPTVETEITEGADVPLNLPSEDKVVRIGVGAESGDLPPAIEGGMNWQWSGAPSFASAYRTMRAATMNQDLTFFVDATATADFELAGITRSFSLKEAKRHTAFARRLQVTDVEDTDDRGAVTTVKGIFSVKQPGKPSLTWTDKNGRRVSQFETGHSVLLWNGEYDVDVFYSVNGQSKQYSQRVTIR